jgi:hypothetical protein
MLEDEVSAFAVVDDDVLQLIAIQARAARTIGIRFMLLRNFGDKYGFVFRSDSKGKKFASSSHQKKCIPSPFDNGSFLCGCTSA